MAMVFCRGCGKEIHETAQACPHCGAPQKDGTEKSLKNQTVAALFAFFLGGFGGHRFYLGKTVSGVIYLLFFWTFIPALIAYVEMIMIAFTSPQKWADKYNNGKLMPPPHVIVKVVALLGPVLFVVGILLSIIIPQFKAYEDRKANSQQGSIQHEMIWSPCIDHSRILPPASKA